jgi:hypothetical protein
LRRAAIGAVASLGICTGVLRADDAKLPVLKVEGDHITAAGRPIRLRGINWGWWHLSGTIYSESDMQHVAERGANVVRLPFSYTDLETKSGSPVWKEDGFAQLDQVVQWARHSGVYVILDMHVVPGGQSTQPYCDGGRNLIWRDSSMQDRFLALWTEIARRYRDRPEVAAYELMNEPDSTQATPGLLRAVDLRAIAAIRRVDTGKIIVVGGDLGSGENSLVDAMNMPDPNILYTFHWYEGADAQHAKIALDAAAFQEKMLPALAFARKFQVPVWVGEFGCEAVDTAYQKRWVDLSISVFEKEKLDWTYWNDKETTDASGMALQYEHRDGSDGPVNEILLASLRTGWKRNSKIR